MATPQKALVMILAMVITMSMVVMMVVTMARVIEVMTMVVALATSRVVRDNMSAGKS